MFYKKILFLDTETMSLDPTVGNIRELAFVKEIEGEQVGDIVSVKAQPIFHFEDVLYGRSSLSGFCEKYNRDKKYSDADPRSLVPFAFPDGSPLFFYAKSARTFNLPAPQLADPSDWVLSKDLVSAKKALNILVESLDGDGKWTLAGHNVSFDYDTLVWWSRRLLGYEEAENILLSKINRHVFLDTLPLVRWFQYTGRIKAKNAQLSTIAASLGLDTGKQHTAAGDVKLTRDIVKILLKEKVNLTGVL